MYPLYPLLLYVPLNRFLQTIIIIIDLQALSLRLFMRLNLAQNLLDIGIQRELVLQRESAYIAPNHQIAKLNHQVKLTGKASQTLGSVPWFLNVPQPVRAYSVNKNDRLLSTMIVI